MAQVFLLDDQNQALKLSPNEQAGAEAVKLEAAAWAEANGFLSLRFHLAAGSDRQLLVQFNDEAPLSSWVDLGIFKQGRKGEIESGLDFARGEFRRRVVGYGQFDR